MRFLVDLYRVLILIFLAVFLVAGTWAAFSFGFGTFANNPAAQAYLFTGLGFAAIVVIIGLGVTATFISIHDRIAELAAQSARIADALERGQVRS
jgi:hypothetical protein